MRNGICTITGYERRGLGCITHTSETMGQQGAVYDHTEKVEKHNKQYYLFGDFKLLCNRIE